MSLILGLLHGLDFVSAHLLVGSVVFYSLILPAGGPSAMGLEPGWKSKIQFLFCTTFITSFLWMLFSSADMTESWSPMDLWAAMSQTSFGHLWCFRLGLILVLLLGVRRLASSRAGLNLLTVLVLGIPVFSSLTSHAAVQESGVAWRVSTDWFHSIAVAVWSGGLWRLFRWLGARMSSNGIAPKVSLAVVNRFSHFAMASTGVIAGTGLLMGYAAGVSLFHPWESEYGKLVLAKVILFTAALAAASINQFIHIRRWTPETELSFAAGIRREAGLEFLLVLGVFGVAGFLARTALPGTL